MSRVKRKMCLEWLPRLQREDGSFGDLLGDGDKVSGGQDLRFCYCAAGIRFLLRGPYATGVEDVRDIDVGKLVDYVQSCQVCPCLFHDHVLLRTLTCISRMMVDWGRHLSERLMVCDPFPYSRKSWLTYVKLA